MNICLDIFFFAFLRSRGTERSHKPCVEARAAAAGFAARGRAGGNGAPPRAEELVCECCVRSPLVGALDLDLDLDLNWPVLL